MYIISHKVSDKMIYFTGAKIDAGVHYIKCKIFKQNANEEKFIRLIDYDSDFFIIKDSIVTMLIFKKDFFKLRINKNHGKAK